MPAGYTGGTAQAVAALGMMLVTVRQGALTAMVVATLGIMSNPHHKGSQKHSVHAEIAPPNPAH